MKKERKLYTSFEQLPLTLNADDIAAYLNISRGNAYTLLHREDFPTLRIGKRMIAPRDRFLAWLDQQMSAGAWQGPAGKIGRASKKLLI